MIFPGLWTKGRSLSAFCLLSSTVLVMLVIFSLEDVLFPSKCDSCEISWDDPVGVIVNIGKTRPLLQRPPLLEIQNLTSPKDRSRRSRPKNKVRLADAEVSENKHDEEVSEVHLSKGDSHSKVETQNKDESRDEALQIQEGGDSQSKQLEQANSNVGSDVEQKEGSSQAQLPPPPIVHSVSYYTKHYKHPVAELRVLTADDGAPRIQSNVAPRDREITIVTQVKEMSARVEEQSGCRLDIQLVTEDGFTTEEDARLALYPVNALRNVALGMAETKLVFLLDADFKPSPRLHESLTDEEETYQDLLRQAREERQLFVVPAFEIRERLPTGEVPVPSTMEELKDGWEKQAIICFHCKQSPTGHMPTKFEKFFDPATTSPYPVLYRDGFEPYVIGALDVIPPYDARFRGYGENKVSHLYSCAADGMGFQVLPNVFAVELPHPPSKARGTYIGKHRDPNNRPRIAGLYNQFKAEVMKKEMEKDSDKFREFLDVSSQKDEEAV